MRGQAQATPAENLETRYEIAIVGHLLGQSPNEWKHQHGINGSREWQRVEEVRLRARPVHDPTSRIDAAKDEHETHRYEREGEPYVAQKTGPL